MDESRFSLYRVDADNVYGMGMRMLCTTDTGAFY